MARPTSRTERRVRGWLRRLLRWALQALGLVFAAAIVLFAALQSDAVADRARAVALARGSEALGLDLHAQRLEVVRLWPPAVRLDGVTVHRRGGGVLDGVPLLRLDSAEVDLGDGLSLADKLVPIRSVRVRGPAARVALEQGKPRDLAHLRPDEPPAEAPDPATVQLGELWVEGAAVRLSLAPADVGIALTGAELGFRQDREGDGAGSFEVGSIVATIGELREEARLQEGGFRIEAGVVQLDGHTLDLRTGPLAIDGHVGLPGAPGGGERKPLTYSLRAVADVALPALKEAWPKLPDLEGDLHVEATARSDGGPPDVDFSVRGEELLIHVLNKRRGVVVTYEGGSPSLIGGVADGVVELKPGSAIRWGGGVLEPVGSLDLNSESKDWALTAGLRGITIERVMQAVTVRGSWVEMGMDGSLSLRGTLKGGLRGRGRGSIAVSELLLHGSAWDAPVRGARMLRVPTAQVETGLLLEVVPGRTGHCLMHDVKLTGPNSDLALRSDFIFTAPLTLDIEVAGERLDLADLDGEIAGIPFSGAGPISAKVYGKTKQLVIDGSLDIADFVMLDKWGFGDVSGDVHWAVQQDLEFTRLVGRRGESRYGADVRLQFANRARGRTRLELAITAELPEGETRAEDILPVFFGDAVPVRGPVAGTVQLGGPPSELSGTIELAGRDVEVLWERFDTLSAQLLWSDGEIIVPEAFVRKGEDESAFVRGSLSPGGPLNLEVRIPRLGLARLTPIQAALGLDGPMQGHISGGVVLGGTLKDLRLDGDVAVESLTYGNRLIGGLRANLRLRDHALAAVVTGLDGRLEATGTLWTRDLWAYGFEARLDEFRFDPFLPVPRNRPLERATGGVAGDFWGEGSLQDAWHELDLTLSTAWIERSGHRVEAPPAKPLGISYRRGAVSFDQVVLVGPEGQTDLRVEGSWRPDGPVGVTVQGPVDIAFLELVGDVFDRAEARSVVLDLAVHGPRLRLAQLEGSVRIKDALLRTIYFPHAVEIDQALVALKNRKLTLDAFSGRLGGGELVDVKGSSIRLSPAGWKPREYDLRATCLSCTLRYPSFLPPTTGDLSLRFAGTAPGGLLLSGHVDVEEMVLRDPLNWQRSALTIGARETESLAREVGQGLFDLDLTVKSAPEAIRLTNNVGRLRGSTQDFRVYGDTARVLFAGTLQVEGGQLPYNGREFTIEPGTARFVEGGSWFPVLDLRMWNDLVSRDRDYRITYAISGPLNRPTLLPTSEPALSENDINSLLLFGLTAAQIEESNLGQLAGTAASAAFGALTENVATSLGQTVGTEALPDRFEIVPVYTDSTGATTLWAVATKEVLPQLLTLEGGVGVGGVRSSFFSSAFRAKLRFNQNFFLEASWVRDDNASSDIGNFGLDLKVELDADP